MFNLKKAITFFLATTPVIPLLALGQRDEASYDPIAIVKQCYYKYQGDDQRSLLTASLTGENGKKTKYEFVRLWKDFGGKNGIVDKVILFSLFPPDNEGVSFMRWGYTNDSDKLADQWV